MYDKLRETSHKNALYRLTELVLKEPAKSKDAPYVFDSKGELVVAGVTNTISIDRMTRSAVSRLLQSERR